MTWFCPIVECLPGKSQVPVGGRKEGDWRRHSGWNLNEIDANILYNKNVFPTSAVVSERMSKGMSAAERVSKASSAEQENE